MSHLSEASLQNDISSKASSRPTTLTSAVIDVSSDHDGDKELQPRTKNRKEEKAKDKQKTSRSLSAQVTFLECISKQQEDAQQRQFEHDVKLQMLGQESEEKREESRKKFELEVRQKEEKTIERMDRARMEHQQIMMQQQQLFQAELFNRLFDSGRESK